MLNHFVLCREYSDYPGISLPLLWLLLQLPAPNPDPIGIPDAILVRPTVVIVFDSVEDTMTIVTPVRPSKTVPARTAYARAVDRLTAVIDQLDRPLDKDTAIDGDASQHVAPVSNTTPEEFRRMVLKGKEYIAAGDIFQVVLAQRFEKTLPRSNASIPEVRD